MSSRRPRPARLVLGGAVLMVVLTMVLVAPALAATPQDIYDDYAMDGKLDGTYTDAELQAVLSDPLLAQYADPGTLDKLKELIRQRLKGRGSFPFTGLVLPVLISGAVACGLGLALRRRRT